MNDTVLVYWIEATTGEFQSLELPFHDLPERRKLESLLISRGAIEPIEITVCSSEERGGHWWKEKVSELLEKAHQIRNSKRLSELLCEPI
jgi:hypothetical protein